MLSAITVCEPEYAPGRFVLIRLDLPSPRRFAWCGRSLGWLPFDKTSSAFFRFFPTEEAACEAAERHVGLPLQE